MKQSILITLLGILTSGAAFSQKEEIKNVKTVISAFAKSADNSNADQLSTYLDDNFRIVMNQLFGSTAVSVMTKEIYIEKIRSKEFGGDKRQIEIQNVVINGNTACAQVTFKGEKMTFVSLITLVKNAEGEWKLISDMPIVL